MYGPFIMQKKEEGGDSNGRKKAKAYGSKEIGRQYG